MKVILFLLFSTSSLAVHACTLCNSKTAKDIRASFSGPDFSFNLLVTILPFIVFSVIVYFIYYGGFPYIKTKDVIKSIQA